jgi:hypothetical protein
MDWVADGIGIAGRREAMDQEQLQQQGVEAVLQLYGPDLDPLQFPLASFVRFAIVTVASIVSR